MRILALKNEPKKDFQYCFLLLLSLSCLRKSSGFLDSILVLFKFTWSAELRVLTSTLICHCSWETNVATPLAPERGTNLF